MPRKGSVNRDNIDKATAMPGVVSSKKAARARDLSTAGQLSDDRGFQVAGVGTRGSVDPLTAVLADGSDVPSQRVLQPTREQLEVRAYEVYLRRAGAPGSPEEDWYQAERELAEELRAEQPRREGAARRPAARSPRKSGLPAGAATADDLRADEAAS